MAVMRSRRWEGAATPLPRSMNAISTDVERGQELFAGFAREANVHDHETAKSSCEPIR